MIIASASQFHVYLPRLDACLAQRLNSVLNVKTPVGAFNQEKALVGAFNQVGAFTVIVKTDGLFAALVQTLVSRVRHNNTETRVFNLRSCCSGPLTTI